MTRESPLGAIIDAELWERVNSRRLAARGQRRASKRATPESVLDGVVFCGRCGHRMYGRVDNPGRYKTLRIRFYCPGIRPGMTPREGFHACTRINTMLADNVIKSIGSQPIRGGATVDVTVTRGVTADAAQAMRRDRLLSRVAEVKAELSNAKRLAIKGLLEDADLAAVAADTDAVISEAQAALTDIDRATLIEVVPFTGTVSDRFAELAASLANEDAPVALRQALLRDFGVMRIYVDNPGIRIELL